MGIVSSAFRADVTIMLTERDDEMVDRMLAVSHKHKVGHRVKTPAGHGHVASIHTNQTFYGVHLGGGTSFFPSSMVEPANDDVPGQPDDDEGAVGAP